jgi:hypothetical protein
MGTRALSLLAKQQKRSPTLGTRKGGAHHRTTSMQQLDFFSLPSVPSSVPSSTPASPIVGMRVQLPQSCSHCGSSIATIGSSGAMHSHRLDCIACGAFCRWLGRREADFITTVHAKFGAPTTPIVFRTNDGLR